MKYTEEEKEVLKIIIENKNRTLSIDLPEETRKTLKIIINLLEKQQKEIKELKSKTQIISPLYIKENYLPKEAIRKKIKELKNKFSTNDDLFNGIVYKSQIDILKELLGEWI